ncbi:collagen alpha-1(I) chain-like [Varanus komodoensis]|uniref:collagen alpha-1(I) chain-like n=1 Tax=Varanus komodoensis TaxID=61221 RepID=UPI001CF7C5E6|nr:collagen alpha-1(I) chain-like [Varanus komodoensis]
MRRAHAYKRFLQCSCWALSTARDSVSPGRSTRGATLWAAVACLGVRLTLALALALSRQECSRASSQSRSRPPEPQAEGRLQGTPPAHPCAAVGGTCQSATVLGQVPGAAPTISRQRQAPPSSRLAQVPAGERAGQPAAGEALALSSGGPAERRSPFRPARGSIPRAGPSPTQLAHRCSHLEAGAGTSRRPAEQTLGWQLLFPERMAINPAQRLAAPGSAALEQDERPAVTSFPASIIRREGIGSDYGVQVSGRPRGGSPEKPLPGAAVAATPAGRTRIQPGEAANPLPGAPPALQETPLSCPDQLDQLPGAAPLGRAKRRRRPGQRGTRSTVPAPPGASSRGHPAASALLEACGAPPGPIRQGSRGGSASTESRCRLSVPRFREASSEAGETGPSWLRCDNPAATGLLPGLAAQQPALCSPRRKDRGLSAGPGGRSRLLRRQRPGNCPLMGRGGEVPGRPKEWGTDSASLLGPRQGGELPRSRCGGQAGGRLAGLAPWVLGAAGTEDAGSLRADASPGARRGPRKWRPGPVPFARGGRSLACGSAEEAEPRVPGDGHGALIGMQRGIPTRRASRQRHAEKDSCWREASKAPPRSTVPGRSAEESACQASARSLPSPLPLASPSGGWRPPQARWGWQPRSPQAGAQLPRRASPSQCCVTRGSGDAVFLPGGSWRSSTRGAGPGCSACVPTLRQPGGTKPGDRRPPPVRQQATDLQAPPSNRALLGRWLLFCEAPGNVALPRSCLGCVLRSACTQSRVREEGTEVERGCHAWDRCAGRPSVQADPPAQRSPPHPTPRHSRHLGPAALWEGTGRLPPPARGEPGRAQEQTAAHDLRLPRRGAARPSPAKAKGDTRWTVSGAEEADAPAAGLAWPGVPQAPRPCSCGEGARPVGELGSPRCRVDDAFVSTASKSDPEGLPTATAGWACDAGPGGQYSAASPVPELPVGAAGEPRRRGVGGRLCPQQLVADRRRPAEQVRLGGRLRRPCFVPRIDRQSLGQPAGGAVVSLGSPPVPASSSARTAGGPSPLAESGAARALQPVTHGDQPGGRRQIPPGPTSGPITVSNLYVDNGKHNPPGILTSKMTLRSSLINVNYSW